MNKLVVFTTIFVLVLVLALPGLLALPIKIIPYNDQPGYSTDYKRGVFGNSAVWQKFTSQEDNLAGIGLSIGNPNLKNKKDVILSLYEVNSVSSDPGSELMVGKSVLNGLNISDGAYVKFLFDPISPSKGKNYIFSLESPEAGDLEVINIFFTKTIPNWIGELTVGDDLIDGSLPMVTLHKSQSKFGMIRGIYVSFLRRLVGIN